MICGCRRNSQQGGAPTRCARIGGVTGNRGNSACVLENPGSPGNRERFTRGGLQATARATLPEIEPTSPERQ